MSLSYYRRHYYIIFQDRKERSGKYPHDVILEKLIAYDVAVQYISEFFVHFCKEKTLTVEPLRHPILITNDARLYLQYRNVFSEGEFEKFCLEYFGGLRGVYDHFVKIVEGRYNTAEMYTKSEEWHDGEGNTYDCEYESGWRTSTNMITNTILTKGANLDDELYMDDMVTINDHHYEWWGRLDDNWKKYFTYLSEVGGIYGDIPTHFALADMLTLEELSYSFGDNRYFHRLTSIEPLSQFHYLRTVNLSHNKIQDLSPLKSIKTLESLNVANNLIQSLLPLQDLINLRELNASSNKIANYDTIPTLRKLLLSSNSVRELLYISKTKNLEHLEMNYNGISNLSELSMLKNLKHLKLAGNKINDIEPLKFLNLETLILDSNQIESLEPLRKMTSLTELSIKNNKIQDLSFISRLSGLKILRCGENKIPYGEALSLSSKLGFMLDAL